VAVVGTLVQKWERDGFMQKEEQCTKQYNASNIV